MYMGTFKSFSIETFKMPGKTQRLREFRTRREKLQVLILLMVIIAMAFSQATGAAS